jgi:hypothetical protein
MLRVFFFLKYDSRSLILNRYISSMMRQKGVEIAMKTGSEKENPCGTLIRALLGQSFDETGIIRCGGVWA